MPGSNLSAAERACWVMGLLNRPRYRDLIDPSRDLDVRRAWLDAVANRKLAFRTHTDYEFMLRKAIRRLLKSQEPYTARVGDQQITVFYHRKTSTLRAVSKPTDEIARPEHLAELFLAADRRVTRCSECSEWFARKTVRRKFCSATCGNRERARRARKRRGVKVQPKRRIGPPAEAEGALRLGLGMNWRAGRTPSRRPDY